MSASVRLVVLVYVFCECNSKPPETAAERPLRLWQHKLLLVALEQELPKQGLADWSILYTGVGKVNAAITLMAALRNEADLLINYGTAGAVKNGHRVLLKWGSLFSDMDVSLLAFHLAPLRLRRNRMLPPVRQPVDLRDCRSICYIDS